MVIFGARDPFELEYLRVLAGHVFDRLQNRLCLSFARLLSWALLVERGGWRFKRASVVSQNCIGDFFDDMDPLNADLLQELFICELVGRGVLILSASGHLQSRFLGLLKYLVSEGLVS